MNPYIVEQSATTHWCCVVAPDGKVVAHCPSKDIAEQVAAALWESLNRLRDDVQPEFTLGGEA